jgi:hypothetical protein
MGESDDGYYLVLPDSVVAKSWVARNAAAPTTSILATLDPVSSS